MIESKVHPLTREILPDDPMEMHGFQVAGDPGLMLRLLVEEYARIGYDLAGTEAARHPDRIVVFFGHGWGIDNTTKKVDFSSVSGGGFSGTIGDIVKTHHDELAIENHFMKSYIQGEGAEIASPLQ